MTTQDSLFGDDPPSSPAGEVGSGGAAALPDPGRRKAGSARRSDPATAHAAARTLVAGPACRLVLDVVSVIGVSWGWTRTTKPIRKAFSDDMIAGLCRMERSVAARRRLDLVEDGWLERAVVGGVEQTSRNQNGSTVAMWWLTDEGLAQLAREVGR